MTRKALGGIIASVVGLVIACTAGGVLLLGGGAASGCTIPPPSATVPVSAPAGGWQPIGRFDSEQVSHAATIAAVGAQMGAPIRGWVIAVATAIQESDLRNLAGGPDDSIGLFQQRPSQGRGTPEQLRDPAYAAGKFYQKLLTVPGWQQMPLTEAAQAVQRSAYPDAYGTHEPDATLLVDAVGSSGKRAMAVDLEQCLSNCPGILSKASSVGSSAESSAAVSPCEWMAPVLAPVVSGFRTSDRPAHDGVDLGATRGTPIRAAAAGVVVVVRCNVAPASHGCDRDGSPLTPGCGWYVDLRHVDEEVYTRYCHMLTRPAVAEGQPVFAGQLIGVVGSSGHSSGPHLHFEVHLNGDPTDPVSFMAAHQAPLGQ